MRPKTDRMEMRQKGVPAKIQYQFITPLPRTWL